MIKPITREVAIRALLSLEVVAFGTEKGTSEAYWDWAASEKLCPPEWDTEEGKDVLPENMPPDFFELFLAMGVSPQEIVNITGVNAACFDCEMCKAYDFVIPRTTQKVG